MLRRGADIVVGAYTVVQPNIMTGLVVARGY